MTVNINNAFPSKYLKSGDIPAGQDLVLTITAVAIEEIGDDQKPIVYFAENEKGLVLNKTNSNTIASLYGPETDAWTGKRIALFSTEVDFQGKQTLALRVRMRPPEAIAAPALDASQPATPDAWEKWYALSAQAEELGIAAAEPPDGVSLGEMRKAYGKLSAQVKAAQAKASTNPMDA